MSGKMNRPAYQQLCDENLSWLRSLPRSLERDHVIAIVERSPFNEYEVVEETGRLVRAERAARLALAVAEQLAVEIEARQRHDEWRAAGSRGMSAPFHGSLAGAAPATMGVLSRWLRDLRRAQGGES